MQVAKAELRGHSHEGPCVLERWTLALTQGWGLGALHFLWHNTNGLFPRQTGVAEEQNNFQLIHKGFVWFRFPPGTKGFP